MLRIVSSLCVIGAVASSSDLLRAQALTSAGSTRVELPRTPVGMVVNEWLAAFNAADSVRLTAFYDTYAVERWMQVKMPRRHESGGFDVISIERATPRLLEYVLQERTTGTQAIGVSELKPGGIRTLRQFAVVSVPVGGTLTNFRIDSTVRARVIERALAKLDTNYVNPLVAVRMADTVRARMKRGEYEDITNGITFAFRLTQHFQEISRDKHLRVNFSASRLPERRAKGRPDFAARERYRKEMERMNCGFEKSETLAGNVGYLRLSFFADPSVCGRTATQAMTALAHVGALIIDLRENGGGDPAMVAHIASYLFSVRTHLNDIWDRRTGQHLESWTKPQLPGKKLSDSVPVYVLLSKRTFSAAEEFSYDLKSLNRATLVGELTAGGAHPTSGHRLDDQFTIGVPFARAVNPITKTNWEGVGVMPHVRVPAADALATAQKMIADRKGQAVP